ncbi:MAG: dockerin type I repeat-containing protein, partial [Acutalibacteraceae bacterium]|nr:dockerin type I repeat-containing protein [Acutalibacteraceae bacterium]
CSKLSDVYYTGSEDDWNDISIGSIHNKYLTNATIHYNYSKPLAGDVTGDGAVAVDDVIYVLKYIVGNTELTEEQIALADVSGDDNLTVLDAVLIQSLILEVA